MRGVENIEKRVLAIIHFKEEEGRPMTRQVHYQVVIDPESTSPSGEFIRFTNTRHCEVHGWVSIDSLVLDEVLDGEFTEEKEQEQLKAAA